MTRADCRSLPVVILWAAMLSAPAHGLAQERRTTFWLAGRADLIGLPGPSGSPALLGVDIRLLRRVGTSAWTVGLVASLASRTLRATPGPYVAETHGLYTEVGYRLSAGVVQPYLFGSLGVANTRIDDNYHFPGGILLNVGGDATTGVLGCGVGIRVRRWGGEAFLDAQYQRRTNAVHGVHALPLRIGVRF